MQIAQEVKRVLSKDPGKIKLEHFKIPFTKLPPPKPVTKAQASAASKMKWFGALGMLGKKKN